MRALVKRITQEVLYRIEQAQVRDETVQGTVVLVSSYVPSPKSALARIKEVYGSDNVEFLNFGTEFTPLFEKAVNADEQPRDEIIEKVASAANVVIVTPRINLLAGIAEGEDDGLVEFLAMRALLWGRNVNVLLDFQPPRFKRNTFFEKVVTVVNTLEDMGIKIMSYKCAAPEGTDALGLVTEQDVMNAFAGKKKMIRAAAGAIVTPSARDKAKELNITINY